MDVAASIQAVLDEVVLRLTRSLAKQTGSRNLCLAGGVALNCVANGKVLRDGNFDNIWIQPAAGDAGGAVGAALAAYHLFKGQPRKRNGARRHVRRLSRPAASRKREIERRLDARPARISRCSAEDEMIETTAQALAEQQAVGWFQGRMEFGPRSLGARSILGDPRSPSHAEEPQSEGQVSRELSALRACGAARGRRGLVRARLRQPVHADRRRRPGRQASRR